MITARHEIHAFADSVMIAGIVFLVGGATAVIWPEPALVLALILIAVTSVVVGFYQLTCGLAVRRVERAWLLIVAHAVLLILFGLLTAGVTGLGFFPAIAVVAGWLVLSAIHSWAVAVLVAQRPFTRTAATLWGAIQVFGALLLVLFSVGTMLALLFLGAVYAATLGAWLIAGGTWLRRVFNPEEARLRFQPPGRQGLA